MSEDRLRRVEEAIGFGERSAEELAAEVLRLNRLVGELTKRMAALEKRLAEAAEAEEEDSSQE